ncbi:GTP 3',8-cyclase MoaA [Paraburkholderia fungorum]|uniref:GTP 3',8-cyclase n=1 Tax=Paraburkholderia fungorum TaxID=134537 RepID=A0AAP5QCY9_9BURK|nr:GTP 3',8-cyclase MoaA [Paraburkholderia fungorum]MDT8840200.1 GTP 3',8-cyclase MoaA [Paraburkholderia fungorum]
MLSPAHRLIPIYAAVAELPSLPRAASGDGTLDKLARPLRDLRISLTDRCNFRCTYCMPKEVFGTGYQYLPHERILSFEEIERLTRAAVSLGVTKIRLTGGEPLLRKGIEVLVGQLTRLRTPDGDPVDVTLTTNGSLLRQKAKSLREAGMTRITVSLDALDQRVFSTMSGSATDVTAVLDGIDAARDLGFSPIKINTVVRRGVNEDEVIPIVRRFRGTGVIPRFIEFMDVGSTNHWELRDVVPSSELVRRIEMVYPLASSGTRPGRATSRTYDFADGSGHVGFISSVTEPFCADCSRLRLTADGRLFTCLFGADGFDVRSALQRDADQPELERILRGVWSGRSDRYSESRGSEGGATAAHHAEMSLLGG